MAKNTHVLDSDSVDKLVAPLPPVPSVPSSNLDNYQEKVSVKFGLWFAIAVVASLGE